MITSILLGLEDILADYVGSALRFLGRADLLSPYPIGEQSPWVVADLPRQRFYDLLNDGDFWGGVPVTPWIWPMVSLRDQFSLCVVSSSVKGKRLPGGAADWLEKQCGESVPLMIGLETWRMARSNVCLIDTDDYRCRLFRERGGQSVVFPQPWNRGVYNLDDRLGFVSQELSRLIGKELVMSNGES